ncbi:hypothetical protein [Flavobacterium coralii]|uniref:hypothetical protein n=1 Tax=Flavobacterium coralii TaxID=2838017 RepID=UPI000C42D263|nr:hypothetical protein [Flavobacterium sp.]|tara:strand:- start:16463 stop:17464 length:1002 start_codon:yes stop_codon:yes gene_type:complete
MNYNEHYYRIKSTFPNLDLVKESEFDLFHNIESARETIKFCIELSENASKKLNIDLCFGVEYLQLINACAKVKYNSAAIIFNSGLIDKLDKIALISVDIFMKETVASLTISGETKDKMKEIVKSCCITYLFYHELAHVLQLSHIHVKAEIEKKLQEKYSDIKCFEIKNHIYEIDADKFGAGMSAYMFLEYIMDQDSKLETILLFNGLTLLLFSIANIIIEFSGDLFQNIYYKEYSHPHPYIRIMNCKEQILSFISKNLNLSAQFSNAVLQRSGGMISQIGYSDDRIIDYGMLFFESQEQILDYTKEIEVLDNNYSELVKHRVQQIFNKLTIHN